MAEPVPLPARERSSVTIAERPPDVSPEVWDKRVRRAQLTLVRVLLRARERLVAEGRLPESDDQLTRLR